MLAENPACPQNINLTSVVKVEDAGERKASVTVPAELRITPQLLELISQALKSQGLELTHMNITEDHRREIGKLSNVVLEENKPTG